MAFLGARMLLTTALTGQLQVTTTSVLPPLLNIIIMNLYLSIESLIINHLPAFHSMLLIHSTQTDHTLIAVSWKVWEGFGWRLLSKSAFW